MIDINGVMQVGSCAPTGVAYKSDDIAPLHPHPLFDGKFGEMRI